MPEQCPEYKIGLTLALLKDVTWYGLLYPTGSPYVPYGVVRLCGNMDNKGYGFASATWLWSSMAQWQLDNLLSFFPTVTDATVDLYIRTYKDYGGLRTPDNFFVKMYRPIDKDGYNAIPGTRFMYSDISAKFAHLVEV